MGPMRRSTALSVLFLVFIAIFGAVFFSLPSDQYLEARTIARGAKDFKDLSERFRELARGKSASYAFEVLQRAQLPANTDLHLLAHTVGDELYKQKGVEGITDCTEEFRNACSHSIVIGALTEFGDGSETIGMIQEACKKAPGGSGAYTMCYHGLGHGVFAYYGYDLQKTVAFCARAGLPLYNSEDSDQCVGGSVMELMGGGGHDEERWLEARARYLDDTKPLSPCSTALIPDGAKVFCFSYLTPRLLQLAGTDLGIPDPATFPKAFSYCDAIPKTNMRLRDACFGGFGKEFVPIAGARDIRRVDQFDDATYTTAALWCLHSPADDGKNACIAQALASVFWGGENDPSASFRFCSNTPEQLRDACYHELSKDIGVYMEGNTRREWCERVPEAYRDACDDPNASYRL